MALVKIASEDLLKIRDALVKTAALEKRAETAERESAVCKRLLGLVARGQLDADVAFDKVAEYTADPMRLSVFEAAADYHDGETKLGTAVDVAVDGAPGMTPEDKFVRTVRDITDGLQDY